MQNSIFVIHPYKYMGVWVFDDEKVGLIREPFVAGSDHILDVLTANIPAADKGFTLLFSANPFPGFQTVFERGRPEYGGCWYYSPALNEKGWLCSALFKYFNKAPAELYVQFKMKDETSKTVR